MATNPVLTSDTINAFRRGTRRCLSIIKQAMRSYARPGKIVIRNAQRG